MDWANVTKIHTPPGVPNAIPPPPLPPPGRECILALRGRAPFGADLIYQNELALWGRECRKRGVESHC